MSDIKFMAFHPTIKRMLPVEVIDFGSRLMSFRNDVDCKFRLGEVQLIRYTGLKDSKETEIYENDLITFEYEEDLHSATYSGMVVWNNDGYWVVDVDDSGFSTAIFSDKISDILVLRRSEGGD